MDCKISTFDKIVLVIYVLSAMIMPCYLSYKYGIKSAKEEVIRSLGTEDKRSIAIDYENQYGSWKNTLHNPCNFAPMDADKETTK